MTRPRPIVHARDHEHGGADPVRIVWESTGTGGGGGQAIFALTGRPNFNVDTNPVILDTPTGGGAAMHFSATDPATFDMSSGRARILLPGMYAIACQINVQTTATLTFDTYAYLHLSYAGDIGYGIEIPWSESAFFSGTLQGEEVRGTRYAYPSGTTSGKDIALQRLHPLSLTTATTFPLEIQPQFVGNNAAGALGVTWLGLWGWRLGEPLDSYHSD